MIKKSKQGLFVIPSILGAMTLSSFVIADAEVTRNSDGSWSARVDGSSVYDGDRYFEAVNAAANNMGTGTINIRNSGSSGDDGGEVWAIRPRAGQTLDFHGHQIEANGGDLVVPIYCDRKDGITVRDVHITGNPRYGVWFRGCSDVTLEDITMDLDDDNPVGLGIRVDSSTADASNLTIKGNIEINGSAGHGIETYGIDGFDIADVTVTNTGNSGLLLNDSRNGTVGKVYGYNNGRGTGYATFRVANDNGPNVEVESVYSRTSGRGFFSVSDSNGTTIQYVDIANSEKQGIFLEDASNTHVLSGSVSNGNPNCQLVRTDTSSLSVDGCDQVGTPPDDDGDDDDSSSDNNGKVNGTYRITPLHSGLAVDMDSCSNSNGTNVEQDSWDSSNCQKWEITPVDDIWHRISPVAASSRALDIEAKSISDGGNAILWTYNAGKNQQFRFQKAGTGKWRIVNRNSELCLAVENSSTSSGANIEQETCTSGSEHQMFTLERQ